MQNVLPFAIFIALLALADVTLSPYVSAHDAVPQLVTGCLDNPIACLEPISVK